MRGEGGMRREGNHYYLLATLSSRKLSSLLDEGKERDAEDNHYYLLATSGVIESLYLSGKQGFHHCFL